MTKQFEQLRILYKQILSTSIEIKDLITKENYDEIISREAHKTQLIQKVNIIKNSIQMTDFEISTLKKIVESIQKQENENLERLNELKKQITIKLNSLNKQNKINSKYTPDIEPNEGSILDFNE